MSFDKNNVYKTFNFDFRSHHLNETQFRDKNSTQTIAAFSKTLVAKLKRACCGLCEELSVPR